MFLGDRSFPAATPRPTNDLPRVLFVDDDANVLEAACVYHGRTYSVDTCTSAVMALELLESAERGQDKQGPYCVVISDMRMPGMDGIQFLAQALRRAPNTVRVVLTGHADLASAREAINQGFVYRFLAKPCPASVMRGHLEDAVRYHRETLVTSRQLAGQLDETTARLKRSERMAVRASLAVSIAERLRNRSEVIGALLDSIEGRTPRDVSADNDDLAELREASLQLREDALQLLEVGGVPSPRRTADVCEVLLEAVSVLRGAGVLHQHAVTLQVPPERALVALGRTLLEQLVVTLLRDLAVSSTCISLCLERTDGHISLVVQYDGADVALREEASIDLRVIAEVVKAEGGVLDNLRFERGRKLRLSLPLASAEQDVDEPGPRRSAESNPTASPS